MSLYTLPENPTIEQVRTYCLIIKGILDMDIYQIEQDVKGADSNTRISVLIKLNEILGKNNREKRLAIYSALTGRMITSQNDLTVFELGVLSYEISNNQNNIIRLSNYLEDVFDGKPQDIVRIAGPSQTETILPDLSSGNTTPPSQYGYARSPVVKGHGGEDLDTL